MHAAPPDPHPAPQSAVGRVVAGRLKQRKDFLATAGGGRFHTKGFSLQARRRQQPAADAEAPRVGFTVTRKVGTSTERNRIRRRLREAIRTTSDLPLRGDHDYVLVGRREALSIPFGTLVTDLTLALVNIHKRDGKGRHRPPAES